MGTSKRSNEFWELISLGIQSDMGIIQLAACKNSCSFWVDVIRV